MIVYDNIPCPWCNSTRVHTEFEGNHGLNKWGYAICSDCSAQTGSIRTQYDASPDAPWRAEAIKDWNTRYDPNKQASEPPLCITCNEGLTQLGQFHCNHCDKDYCPTCFPGHPCACHIYDRVRENSAKQASEPPLCEACDMEVGWRQCNHCATALCAVCFPEHLCNRLGRVIDE